MSKKLLFFVLFVFLCGCAAPSTTFLGPTFTGVKTGSVYQTSLSYGSGKIVNSLKESYTNTIIETNKLSFKENEIYEDSIKLNNPPLKITLKIDIIEVNKVIIEEPLP